MTSSFSFTISKTLSNGFGRTGVISTPHGEIFTPAFIPVGTQATVKAMTSEMIAAVGAQAVLANTYHLYLRPGYELIREAGGLHTFMNWDKPTFTDSGGFQVLSLGSGYKKTISMDSTDNSEDFIAKKHNRKAHINDEGVDFISHIDGSRHRFTPQLATEIQFAIGADIIFAFDELTSLFDSKTYQREALNRTHAWAQVCLDTLRKLQSRHPGKPKQALFGVLQGAHYKDLRQMAAHHMSELAFDGYGLGGALQKENLGEIISWMTAILPSEKPKHMLGLSEPDDIFTGIEYGVDTFDCVSPTRVARNGSIYTFTGRIHISGARYKRDFGPLVNGCDCYTCQHHSRAYVHHLFKANEMLASTLASIHNERFIIRLVDSIRESIANNTFRQFKQEFLRQYYG